MATIVPDLTSILALLREGSRVLRAAELEANQLAPEGAASGDLDRLQEILHVATHELGSQLGFYVQDIEALQRRLTLRAEYSEFSASQFDRIVREGWSTNLACEMFDELGDECDLALNALSTRIKELVRQWGEISEVA